MAVGSYYTYLTDQGFKSYVDSLLDIKVHDKDSTQFSVPHVEPKRFKDSRKRISKTLKPDKFSKLDQYARQAPKQYESNIEVLAKYLVSGVSTDIEKARVLFTWVATHIKYDADAFSAGIYPSQSGESILLTRKAVCAGYSDLLKKLCTAVGLESEDVSGYCKGYSYHISKKINDIDHAWTIIKIDNRWRLFDATWASGYVIKKNNKLISVQKFNPYWFDVNPREFIFTHLPEESKWQLIQDTISLEQFAALPRLDETFFNLGFDVEKCFSEALNSKETKFVHTYASDFPFTAIDLPYRQSLKRNDTIKFVIQSDYADAMVLFDDSSFNMFKQDGSTFTLTHIPKGRHINICVRINWYEDSFSTIAKYDVVNQRELVNNE